MSQGTELRTRSRYFRRRGKVRRLKYTWKSAGYNFKRITERKDQPCRQYNPCGCQSTCGKQCPCLSNGTCCEKYCGWVTCFLCISLLACINLVVNLHVETSVHVLQMGHAVRNTVDEFPVFPLHQHISMHKLYVQYILYIFCAQEATAFTTRTSANTSSPHKTVLQLFNYELCFGDF